MIIALVAACIVLLATAIIMVFGQKSWDRTLRQANLQRDASYAILKIKVLISGAANVHIDADNQGITIDPNADWVRFWFVLNQKDLEYQFKEGAEETLLDGVVKGVTFNVDPHTNKAVMVDLQLQNGDCEAQLSSTTMMRNYSAGP
jgi:hypothetical protein